MDTASASRSTRSAVSTVSAASEEAVEPRAHCHTDVRGGQRGGVVHTVTHHDGDRAFVLGPYDGDLAGRV
jgi:hypothetical protein